MTVILITHKLHEVMAFSDRVGVMKQGKLAGIVNTAETDEHRLAAMMVGREVLFDELRAGEPTDRAVLTLHDLKAKDDRGLPAVKGVSLTVHAGEIVGICGVEGNGQTELTESIMGMRPQTGGEVSLNGVNISRLSPREIRNMGVSYIPADRLRTGLSATATVMENMLVGKQRQPAFRKYGVQFRKRRATAYARELSEAFDVRSGGVDLPMNSLSGGNMQKAVIAREFSFDTPVLIINQPTRGVDIGAVEFIHEKILEKTRRGLRHPAGKRGSGRAVPSVRPAGNAIRRAADRRISKRGHRQAGDQLLYDRRQAGGTGMTKPRIPAALSALLQIKPKQRLTAQYLLSLLIAVTLAFGVGAGIMLLCGYDPIACYAALFKGALGKPRAFGNTLAKTATLCLTGLAMSVAAKAGIFNVGGEGQLYFGGLAAAIVGARLAGAPAWVIILCALLAAVGRRWAVRVGAGHPQGQAEGGRGRNHPSSLTPPPSIFAAIWPTAR